MATINVLLIEDDLDFASLLIELLEADPEFVIQDCISNEADARDHLYAGSLQRVDAVLIDLHLAVEKGSEEINNDAGIELIKEMREQHKYQGRIIVLTNSNSAADGAAALKAGCDGYLCKHVRLGDLAALISELRMALHGDVVMLAKELKHVFLRGAAEPTVEAL